MGRELWGMYRSTRIGRTPRRTDVVRLTFGAGTKPRRRMLRRFIRVLPGCLMPAVIPACRRNHPRSA